MQYFISELIVLIHKHVNAVFISCSIHHVGLALHLEGILDVHQKTFQIMQQNTETDGEIVLWISEKARNDDDDYTVAVYNTTM